MSNTNANDFNPGTLPLRFARESLDITDATLIGYINEIVNISFQPVTYVTYLKSIAITVIEAFIHI